MEIVSIEFALLAIVSVFIFYFLNPKYRIAYLTILSCGFMASLNYSLAIYVIIYAYINYLLGLKISNSEYKKNLFRTGILINLSQLIILRYASFAIDPIFKLFHSTLYVSKLSTIIIPIGISYFTLQGIGYLINIKMGWEKPEKKFLDFLLYISFYPKFLSGPIERSNHFLPQLKKISKFNEKNLTEGLRIALIGFFKKIVVANQLAPFITGAYSNPGTSGGLSPWIIILIQPLYLYFDFSGYTNIAIGFAKTFGIDLLPNFNKPFMAENMTNFWKRFHMSLSSWFNDYVFRQTSFKYRRWGISASVFAVFVTWILFGIWHGAGWNFMMLGLVQALAIVYEFFTKKWRVRLFSLLQDRYRIWLGRICTYIFYGGSLVFFFSPNLKTAFKFFNASKHLNLLSQVGIEDKRALGLAFCLIAVFLITEILFVDRIEIFKKFEKIWNNDKVKYKVMRYTFYYMVILCIFYFGRMQTDFIYFQF
jgi:alginate O-acetyltransferase complex protein AlgI